MPPSAASPPRRLPLERYMEGILRGDRVILARAITLVESDLAGGWRTGRAAARLHSAAHRQFAARRHHRRAGRRQEHLHRRPGHAPDSRTRRARRRAQRRSLQPAFGRQHPRRQDAHGAARAEDRGLHPPLALARPPGRRGPAHARNHAALRGCRLSRTCWWKPWAWASRKPPCAP